MLYVVLEDEEGGHGQHPKQPPRDQGGPESRRPAMPVPPRKALLMPPFSKFRSNNSSLKQFAEIRRTGPGKLVPAALFLLLGYRNTLV